MGHTPYGYRIEGGRAVIDEDKAGRLRALFDNYLDGMSLIPAAEKAGINGMQHSSIGRLLRNKHYLGDEFYPPIIDQELFDIAEEERKKRAGDLGRIREYTDSEAKIFTQRYKAGCAERKFDDPFKQAAYAYSLIETEE